MQVRTDTHTRRFIAVKEHFEGGERSLTEDIKQFFKLFQESTFEGSQAAARKMKKIARRQTKYNQKFLLFHSLYILAHSDLKMLSWPNSPLLVMLHFIDPDVLFGDEETSATPLHYLTDLAVPNDYSTHENQLTLAKQLIERGANVDAVSSQLGRTPLHHACCFINVTNLDFVEYLLENGADPNYQDNVGAAPLMTTLRDAPSATKYLLKWPTTDVNITMRSGESFPGKVGMAVEYFSDKVALPDNPDQVQDQFVLQQWRAIEEMLVERGAHDTGTTNLE
jgi:hypothetical protein